jgi:hypothetical protein
MHLAFDGRYKLSVIHVPRAMRSRWLGSGRTSSASSM